MGDRVGNLYYLRVHDMKTKVVIDNNLKERHIVFFSLVNVDFLWHRRFGHPSCVIKQQLNQNLYFQSGTIKFYHCKTCHMAKQKRLPFVSNNKLSSSVFDLIHMDA